MRASVWRSACMAEPTPDPRLLAALLTVLEAMATIAFALSGLLEAARKRLDAVGVCVVAGLAALMTRLLAPSASTGL